MSTPGHGDHAPGAPAPSLSSTVLRGGGWLGVAALVQAFLQIAIFAVLARLLTPAEFGLVAVAGIFIDLAAGVAVMGTSQALVQRAELTADHIRAAFCISMVMGLSMTAILFVMSDWLAIMLGSPASAPLISAMAATFAIRGLIAVPEGLAARRWRFRVLAVRQVTAYIVGYGVVGITSALMGAGPWALVYAQLSQAAIEATLLILTIRFPWLPTVNWAAYREILGFGTGFSVVRIANSMANQVDRAIVAIHATPSAVGLYTRALQVARYPATMVGQVIENVLFPSFAGVQSDRTRLKGAYLRSIGSIFVTMTPVAVFFSFAAQPIADVLLGPQWIGAVPLFVIFGANIPFRSAQRISNALLLAVGYSWLIAAFQILLLGATAIGALIGVRWGLTGVATAVFTAFVLHYVVTVFACGRILSLNWMALVNQHLIGLPLSVFSGFTAWGCSLLATQLTSLLALTLAALIFMLISLVAVYASPGVFLQNDGRWLLSLLLSKVPQRVSDSRCLRHIAQRIAL